MTTSTDKIIEFRTALYEIANTENGKLVFEFLEKAYVDSPALAETSEITHYRLGQKEFVQGLIKDAAIGPEELKKLAGGE